MKKLFKYLCAVVLLFVVTLNVHAADTVTFTYSSNNWDKNSELFPYFPASGGDYHQISGAGTTYKTAKLSDGTTVMAYCFNHAKEAPAAGTKLTLRNLTTYESKNINSFVYILENGWNGSTWKRTSKNGSKEFTKGEKYYITQLTIWGLQGTANTGIDLAKTTGKTSIQKAMINAAQAFLKDAKAHNSQAPVAVTLSPTSSYMTLSSDGKYYQTKEYSVGGSGYSTYTVTLNSAPSGTEIYIPKNNVIKKSGSTVNAGKGFIIRIPAAQATKNATIKFTVAVSGTYKNLKIYRYTRDTK